MGKKLLVMVVLMLCAAMARAQSDEWHESDNWRLYDGRHKYRSLNEDSMRAFMAHPTRIPAGKQPRWKGVYQASCELDEVTRKVDLSADGTFFFDEFTRAYYLMAPEIQKAWAAYLAACSRSLR